MPEKIRLDLLISKQEGVSRNIAVDMIKEGRVRLQDKVLLSPGAKFFDDSIFSVEKPEYIYVGRGGYKLEKALKHFSINLQDKICIDIGASTGGFTDCMLRFRALKVYAVDTGTDQLAESLRNDKRVISMEKTDIRDVNIDDNISFASVDVSFISLGKILKNISTLLNEKGEAVCLIKPQFEAGPENVGKDGVVKNRKIHLKILENMYNIIIGFNFTVKDIIPSPIKGGDGNIEYLIYISKSHGDGLKPSRYKHICTEINEELFRG